eukprot:TRINITY_DN5669_c1_g1_i1.p1 TRINITY_DN5669_c1_g1~~TRINITY_DN5669_c1_g1_i1.p1  ORF type:complete len:573 (+),score=141.12 TRINITY_DN5669_c1_g1_i1:58-1719(+)
MAAGDKALAVLAFWAAVRRLGLGKVLRISLLGAILWAVRRVTAEARRRRIAAAAASRDFKVAVIGGGFSGVCAGVQLGRMGVSYTMFERSSEGLGGTWRENTYPGCECDVASAMYSFSFARNPEWSRRWSPQPEILAYLRKVAEDFGVMRNCRTGADVASARWVPGRGMWDVEVRDTATGQTETLQFNAVITCTGQLNKAARPRFPGLDSFKGPVVHTAEWDPEVDLKGKKVACIGTGASAIQVVPELAKIASHLTLFQRSATYVLSKGNYTHPAIQKWFFRHFDVITLTQRFLNWLLGEVWFLASFVNANPQPLRNLVRWAFTTEMKYAWRSNPELRDKLIPKFPVGCKRTLFTDDYAGALLRSNVSVVTEGIEKLTETGIVSKDGKTHELDAIVLATGFDAQRFLLPLQVYGASGKSLQSSWTAPSGALLPRSYYGITVPDFPNFFMMYGPATNLGSNSIIFMIECQMQHVCAVLERTLLSGRGVSVVTEEAAARFHKEVTDRVKGTVFADESCGNWYKNADGVVVNNWPSTTFEYMMRTRGVSSADYEFQ